MFNFHRAKDGTRMLICNMDTDHIKNYLTLQLEMIKTLSTFQGRKATVWDHVMGTNINVKDAAKSIKTLTSQLHKYITEYALRKDADLEWLRKTLQEVYERQDAIPDVIESGKLLINYVRRTHIDGTVEMIPQEWEDDTE